jgi:hypothetical protein
VAESCGELSSSDCAGYRRTANALAIASEKLDFTTSVKRGGFKSKHRWVSLRG